MRQRIEHPYEFCLPHAANFILLAVTVLNPANVEEGGDRPGRAGNYDADRARPL